MHHLLDMLIAPFHYPFMVHSLLAVLMVGIVCSVIGTYVVLRGMAFLGDAISHAILPGVAIGYLLGGGLQGGLFWWGLGTAIVTSLGIGAVCKGSQLKADTAIGIIFAGMFALGIALISTIKSYAVDLMHLLFGNVLSVTTHDLGLIAVFGGATIITIVLLYKEFLAVLFDPVLASTLRLPVGFLNNLLYVLLAVAIVVSLQTVGIALMIAMLVTPAATAYLLTQRLSKMMLLSATIGALSGVTGLYLSFYLNIASGAAVVLVSTSLFWITFLFSPRRGLLWKKSRQLRR